MDFVLANGQVSGNVTGISFATNPVTRTFIPFLLMKIFRNCLIVLSVSAFFCPLVNGQQLSINTKKIDLLLEEWNIIHNGKIFDAFENVYDDKVLFYTQTVPQKKVTLMKKLMFTRNPAYRQRISSDITYTLHKNGIVKCDFTREVFEDDEWKPNPMYLLVGFKNQGYWIVGESDYETDKRLRYTPKLGDAIGVEILSANIGAANHRLVKTKNAGLPNNTVSAGETVSVPKNYLYILIVLVSTGGLIVFVSETIRLRGQRPRSTRPARQPRQPVLEEPNVYADESFAPREKGLPAEAFQVIENNLKQKAFRSHAMSLFDPVSFKVKNSDSLNEHGSNEKNPEPFVDYEFNYRNGDSSSFTVQFLYREDTGNEVRLFPSYVLQKLNNTGHDVELYYVIGVGGPPDYPNELYLIPWRQIRVEVMSKEELKPFRRSGRFVYNTAWGRLQ
jgi:hypothetical protein